MEQAKLKDSGVQWIGKIPEDWTVKPIKYYSELYTGNSISDNEKSLYENIEDGWPYISTKDINAENNSIDYINGMIVPFTNHSFKIALKHFTLLCIEGGSAGKKIGYLNQDVAFVNKLCCFRPKEINPRYQYYSLQTDSFKFAFNQNMSGLIGGVSTSVLKNIKISCAPINQQQKIAKFLDDKCGNIDEIIKETEDQIETLEKYKKSLITEVVTKGLNPTAPMKDSGIEWIGQISAHWEVNKIKYVSEISPKTFFKTNTASFLPMDLLKNGYFINQEGSIEDYNSSYTCFQDNDVIMAKVTPCFENGNIAILKNLINGVGFGSSELYVFRARKHVQNKFLFYFLQNNELAKSGVANMTGAAGLKRIPQKFVGNYLITIPNIEEQQEIVEYLDKKCEVIDETLEGKKKAIETLRQYKNSLIYEYVTGKKRV